VSREASGFQQAPDVVGGEGGAEDGVVVHHRGEQLAFCSLSFITFSSIVPLETIR
jgi:hypothetical protein